MPKLVQYKVKVETRVVVLADNEPVAEYIVAADSDKQWSDRPGAIPNLVEVAMTKNVRQTKVMAAAVENNERSRLK